MNPHKLLTAIGVAGMAYMAVAMSYGPTKDADAAGGASQAIAATPDHRAGNEPVAGEVHGPMPQWLRDVIVVAIRGTGF